MQVTPSKLASLIIAIFYVRSVAIAADGGINDILTVCAMLVIPLALIWFPDEIGSTALRGGWRFVSESPGILVAAMGWFFLVGMPLLIYLLSS